MRHSMPGAPFFWREPPDGGCVVPAPVYLRGSEYFGGLEHKAGGRSARRREDTLPHHSVWGSGAACSHSWDRRIPRALKAGPTNHRGPRLGVWPLTLKWDSGVLRCVSSRGARCRTPPVPLASPSRANNVRFSRGHGIASGDPRWEERAPEVFREAPRQVLVRVRVSSSGTLQGAVH